ncbi:hypothetical protein [Shimia sagamensis]|uniref:Uncharacterized protein n=1 Tax=Shimia sagamensis TaxID=1566352 RepID=A0ABY1NTX4_9RHOB|nr:hypothetical protein [Shimia sagamensis]SMP17435.1 hypothetical protein SAMN06265373_103140 [Shimia sagamensis]
MASPFYFEDTVLMYLFQVYLAAHWDWRDTKVSEYPKAWVLSLTAVAVIFTFLPAWAGAWALVFYPIGWVTVLPGLILAGKKRHRAHELLADQVNQPRKTKKLIERGQGKK